MSVGQQFDPLGFPPPPPGPYPFPTPLPGYPGTGQGVPPAVAARQRADAKKDEKRKIGSDLLASATAPGSNYPQIAGLTTSVGHDLKTAPPPNGQPPPPQAPQYPGPPQEALPQTPPAQEQVPPFTPAQYKAPNKGLEYLALGISLLFPGAPIARLAAGFAGGLSQGAEQGYQRKEHQAEEQYKVTQEQARVQAGNQDARRAAEIEAAQ